MENLSIEILDFDYDQELKGKDSYDRNNFNIFLNLLIGKIPNLSKFSVFFQG